MRRMRILQSGHDENLKNVRMTRLPLTSAILKVEPSIAGRENSGAVPPSNNTDITSLATDGE
jgi:hypothetical protein